MGSDTRGKILSLLSDCRPRSFSEIVKETGLGRKAVEGALYRLWKEGRILRSERQFMEAQRIFKGRGGITRNLRKYYLYVLKPEGRDSVEIDGVRFVRYGEKGKRIPRVQGQTHLRVPEE